MCDSKHIANEIEGRSVEGKSKSHVDLIIRQSEDSVPIMCLHITKKNKAPVLGDTIVGEIKDNDNEGWTPIMGWHSSHIRKILYYKKEGGG